MNWLSITWFASFNFQKRKEREREEILHGFQELLQKEAFHNSNPETGMVEAKTYKYDAFVSCAVGSPDANFLEMLITVR